MYTICEKNFLIHMPKMSLEENIERWNDAIKLFLKLIFEHLIGHIIEECSTDCLPSTQYTTGKIPIT